MRTQSLIYLSFVGALWLANCAGGKQNASIYSEAGWPSNDISNVSAISNHLEVSNSSGVSIVTQDLNHLTGVESKHSSKIFISRYEQNGTRVMAVNADGKIIVSPEFLYPSAKIDVSKSFAVVRYQNGGDRVLVVNAKGDLMVSSALQQNDPEVMLSDDLVVVTSKSEDGKTLSIWAQNKYGQDLIDRSSAFPVNSKIQLSNRAVVVTFFHQGDRILAVSYRGKLLVQPEEMYTPDTTVSVSDTQVVIHHPRGVITIPIE